jgi:hypothetical protein
VAFRTKRDPLIEQLVQDSRYDIRADGTIYTKLCPKGRELLSHWREASVQTTPFGHKRFSYRSTQLSVHRVIYRRFNGPLSPTLAVNHIDGDPANNTPANLELVTIQENNLHSFRRGRKPTIGNKKLSPVLAEAIRADQRAGLTYRQLMCKYGVCKSTISYVVNNRTWKTA